MLRRERQGLVRRKVARAALAGVLPLLGIGLDAQARDPITRRLNVDGTQIDDGDTWTGQVDFTTPALRKGEKLVFNLDFGGNSVTIGDSGFSSDEEIYFRFLADAPPGAGRTHVLDYKWTFTGTSGELLVTTITGTGQIRENGAAIIVPGFDITARRDIDLTDSSFTFGDITLELMVPDTLIQWKPISAEFSVSGDSASVEQKTSWAQPSGGSWMLASNWVGGVVPNGVGKIVEFGPALTSNSVSVSLNGPVTVGTLIHNDNSSLSLSNGSGGSLTFDVASGMAGLHIDSTGFPLHQIHATTTLRDDLLIHFSGPTPNEVFYNGNIGEGVPGRSILVKGGPGRLALNGNNSFTGGITADGVLVELNTATAQGAVGSRATAVNGGQIDMGHMPTAAHRYTAGALSMISGNSSQLGALTVGVNLELAEGAILGFEQNNSARPAGAIPGQLFYGVNGGSLTEDVTIGGGSWRGVMGSAQMNTYQGGTMVMQGAIQLGSLGGRSLILERVVDMTRDGSTITVLPGSDVEIRQPPGNSGTQWDLGGILRLGQTIDLNGPVTLRRGGGLGSAHLRGVTITNPAYSDTTGSRLLSGDSFESPFGGAFLPNAGVHFNGGHTYPVNSTFAGLGGLSNPNLGVKGPNTTVRFGGTVENPGAPFSVTNMTVQAGGRLVLTDQATFFVTNAQGQPGPVLFWGPNGGGTVEFEPGFVADPVPGTQAGESTPGLRSGFFLPGVTVVTNHGQNVPHMSFDFAPPTPPPTAPDTWRMATNPHAIAAQVDLFRPMVIQTDVPVMATGLWNGTAQLTKTGAGRLTFAETGRLDGTTGLRVTVPEGTLSLQSAGRNRVGGFRVTGGGALEVTGNLEVHPGPSTVNLVNGGLSLGGTPQDPVGRIDLANTNMVYAPAGMDGSTRLGNFRVWLRSGLTEGQTPWTGPGIVSSTARSDRSLGIGFGPASFILKLTGGQTGTWMGETVDGSAVLARLTKVGDATLDGIVDFDDLALLAQNYNTTDGSAFWHRADFTYDGIVDFNDLARFAQNYNSSVQAPIPGAPAEFYSDWGAAIASVPEPAGGAVVLGLLAGVVRRRRR